MKDANANNMVTEKLSAFQVRNHVIALLELLFWSWNVRYSSDAFDGVRKYVPFHYCAAVWHHMNTSSDMLNSFAS